jgi:hypothetical protein
LSRDNFVRRRSADATLIVKGKSKPHTAANRSAQRIAFAGEAVPDLPLGSAIRSAISPLLCGVIPELRHRFKHRRFKHRRRSHAHLPASGSLFSHQDERARRRASTVRVAHRNGKQQFPPPP